MPNTDACQSAFTPERLENIERLEGEIRQLEQKRDAECTDEDQRIEVEMEIEDTKNCLREILSEIAEEEAGS